MPSPLDALVDAGAELARLGSGYQFTEGPVWNAAERCLLFNDIPGDTRWRWSEDGGVERVLQPTFKSNGMAYDVDGHLLVCEHVTSSVVRFKPGGARELVAYHYEGTYLNSPNDVVAREADGGIYFTDPDYGRWNDHIGAERSRELGFKGLFRVPHAGGDAELLVDRDEFDQPNGLCFSPDESVLYVNDSPRMHVKVWDVRADGTLESGRLFFEGIGDGSIGSAPDGMECDELGNVWVTGPGGVWVIDPTGTLLGVVEAPEVVGSVAWGGDDRRRLFLTASTSLFAIDTLVAGAKIPNNH